MKNLLYIVICLLSLLQISYSWPDGAPCVHAAFESMNPLEAVEHQGGLQLTQPPFYIEVDRQCYWRNQPIGLTLKGNSTKDKFKGFVIQPIVWKGTKQGRRIGQFMRLDDNGSWQNQCFAKKDSVTHSHDTMKTFIKLWWKNDEDETQYVQFVSTVVINLKKFWVKSVLSPPIPPCRIESKTPVWVRPPVTHPPPPSQFKIDTWRIFNHESSGTFPRSINSFELQKQSKINDNDLFTSKTAPTLPPPPPRPVIITTTTQRPVGRQKLTHIIPLPNMEFNSRPHATPSTISPTFATTPSTLIQRRIITQQRQNPSMLNRLMQLNRQVGTRLQNQQQQQRFLQIQFQQRQQQQQLQQQQQRFSQCFDSYPQNQCLGWIMHCQQSRFMQTYCRRTCRMC